MRKSGTLTLRNIGKLFDSVSSGQKPTHILLQDEQGYTRTYKIGSKAFKKLTNWSPNNK